MSLGRDKLDATSERIIEKRRRDRELNKNSYIEDTSVFKGKTLPNRFNTDSNFSQNMVGDTTTVVVSFDNCFPSLPQPDDEGLDSNEQRGAALGMQPKLHAIAGRGVNPMAYGTEVSTKRHGSPNEVGKYRVKATTSTPYLGGMTGGAGATGMSNLSWGSGAASPVKRPATPGPAVIEEKAKNYDDSTDLPNKAQHAPMFESDMHPDFVAYAKAVIFDIWDQVKGTMTLNSTFRSVGKQRTMRAKWDAWKAGTGPNPNYAARPAKAGYSKHNLGTAIDFNVTIGGTVYGRRSVTKEQWIASGVPNIITSNGLVWGGVWDNYDPIHMHLDVTETVRKEIIAASGQYTDPSQAIAALSSVAIAGGTDNSNITKPVSDTEGGPV